MLRALKARFSKDRWEVRRLSHWQIVGRDGIRETHIHVRNRYNGALKVIEKRGEWRLTDFRNNTFRR